MIYLWEHRPVLKVLKRYSWKESGAGRRIRSNLSPPRGGLKNCVNDFNSRISGNSVMTWIWGECAERVRDSCSAEWVILKRNLHIISRNIKAERREQMTPSEKF